LLSYAWLNKRLSNEIHKNLLLKIEGDTFEMKSPILYDLQYTVLLYCTVSLYDHKWELWVSNPFKQNPGLEWCTLSFKCLWLTTGSRNSKIKHYQWLQISLWYIYLCYTQQCKQRTAIKIPLQIHLITVKYLD